MANVNSLTVDLIAAVTAQANELLPSFERHQALRHLAVASAAMGMENPLHAFDQLSEAMKCLDAGMYRQGVSVQEFLY